ncbi:MAG: EF-hand domain-containing protein [Pseudomonadota bacterium]
MRMTTLAGAVALVSLGATGAVAQNLNGGRSAGLLTQFDTLDTDGSGTLSAEEIAAGRAAAFAAADSNGDGQLSEAEMADMLEARFRAAARANAEALAPRTLSRLDRDEDDTVDDEEFTRAGRRQEQVLGRADTDGDGEVSRAEIEALVAERGERRQGRQQGRQQNREQRRQQGG